MRFHEISQGFKRCHEISLQVSLLPLRHGDPSDNEMLLLAIVSLIDHGYLDIVNRDTFFWEARGLCGQKKGPFQATARSGQ